MVKSLLRTLGIALALCMGAAIAAPDGNLQIHFMDVWQGDGAVLISPQGEVVMFDDGNSKRCEKPLAYLETIGITEIDYHINSHYHADHLGCASEIFSQFKLKKAAYDRGETYRSKAYDDYVNAVKDKRKTAQQDDVITLDKDSGHPVKITIVALNGNGITTTNENDLSVVALVEFDGFRVEIGGDLSGEQTNSYKDIESSVSTRVKHIDVYKVHHHCSAYSSNKTWLDTTTPTIGIISVGDNNDYGHPTEICLERLHDAGVKTYWTEKGNGAQPDPHMDVVAGTVLVTVVPGATEYTVSYASHGVDVYPIGGANSTSGGSTNPVPPTKTFAWAKSSSVYHEASCPVVKQIKAENLIFGDTPPEDRRKHNCPDQH